MHSHRATILGSLVIAALTGTACAASDPSAKTLEDYDAVARSLGSSVAERVGGDAMAMADATSIALGVPPPGFALDGAGHVVGAFAGLAYDYALACVDVHAVTMRACSSTTEAAVVQLDWRGALAMPGYAAEVQRTGAWSLVRLQGEVATLNGESSFAYDSTVVQADRSSQTYRLDIAARYDAIKLEVAPRALLHGTARYEIDAERTIDGRVDGTFAMAAELFFHADGTAALMLDGEQLYMMATGSGAVVKL